MGREIGYGREPYHGGGKVLDDWGCAGYDSSQQKMTRKESRGKEGLWSFRCQSPS